MTPKQRFRTLATLLRTVPPEKFDLWSWRSAPGAGLAHPNPTHTLSDQSLTDPSCRTAGCAVGWACAYPAFQAEGLSFHPKISAPAFNGHTGWEAVEGFFGLSPADASYLFRCSGYPSNPTPDMVADRIEKFIRAA